MSSDDIKIILRKFYMPLRKTVQPQDIAPIIDGLTDFDRQQIAATAKNEGSILGNDKLLDTLGRRTTRSFISFVTLLRDSNSELAEEIMGYTCKYFQHIYNSFQNYQKEQSIPSAAVKPSVTSHTSSHTHSYSRSTLQVTYNREQESTYTASTHTVRPSVLRTEFRPVTFSEDTLLEDVPNIIFVKWASELNHGDSWNKLGDILPLTRKQIRELKNKSNPGEEILDLLCSKEEVTVKGLTDLLQSVQLTRVVEVIKQSLEPTAEFTDGRETQANGTEDIHHVNLQASRNQQQEEVTPPVEEVKKCNLNGSTESTTNNEDTGETTGAECINKTLINNLNTSNYKFEMVKEVRIYLPGDGDKTQIVKDSNISNTESVEREVSSEKETSTVEREISSDSETSTVEREVSSEENMTPSPGINTQINPVDSMSIGNHQSSKTRTQLFEQSTGTVAVSSIDEDHILQREPEVLGQIITQPSPTDNEKYGKNAEQERADLSIELRNQPNLDSFRDIRNSIPDNDQSTENTALKQHGNERHYSDLVHQPTSTHQSESTLHGKNIEQEYQAFHRDVTNQQMFDGSFQ